MKEIRTYKCEKCGAIFDDPARAEECEGSHVDPYRITEAMWNLSVDCNGSKMGGYDVYPKWVRVMMADGNIVTYGTDGGNTMQPAFYKGKTAEGLYE